jgi:V8-like Glu-specific endopeptidase
MSWWSWLWLAVSCHELPFDPERQHGVVLDSGEEPEVVDHGDGTWSYALAPSFDPTALVEIGPVTWAYVDQARFSWDPVPMGEQTFVARPDTVATLGEHLIGSIRLDREGRRWVAAAADVELAAELVARADEDSIEDVDDEPNNDADDRFEQPGDVVTWYPHSWTTGDCDGAGWLFDGDDNHYFDGDSRLAVATLASPRQDAIVDVRVYGDTQCTGVILRDRWILTAGHCLFDGNHNPIPDDAITIVRQDKIGQASHDVLDSTVSPWFTSNGTDPSDDYALLELVDALDAPFNDMDLSRVPESFLKSLDAVHNVALPGSAPGCGDNVSDSGIALRRYVQTGGPLGSMNDQRVNLKMDGGPGHSGSPIFYCPEGDDDVCTDDETGFVIAVWSGWNGFTTTQTAARASRFRGWAIALMDGW